MVDMPAENVEQVIGVRFNRVGKLYHFGYGDCTDVQPGDFVIVETTRGRQMGQVMGFAALESDREYRPIMRMATPRDLALYREWESKQDAALAECVEIANSSGGYEEAKFVAAQYNYDGSMLTFLFTAEEKIDTSKLRRQLNRKFDTVIEMRQIGPRDVAKLLGGFGACGIERCCSTFLTDFSPISIKMAKAQGISLNPSEITGMCGRLRCCLVYEYEQYVEARKKLPRKGKKIGTPYGECKVIDVHPLRDAVTVWVQDMGRTLVEREDIVPLEELRALEKAAKSPCSKHGDEPCDCGKQPGERRADQ
ncbi:MAG: stage 0 sporulation family protein [Anaerolineae bacterium]|nr:stage 0 sporulation family protein [Anaerolineae bacterium]